MPPLTGLIVIQCPWPPCPLGEAGEWRLWGEGGGRRRKAQGEALTPVTALKWSVVSGRQEEEAGPWWVWLGRLPACWFVCLVPFSELFWLGESEGRQGILSQNMTETSPSVMTTACVCEWHLEKHCCMPVTEGEERALETTETGMYSEERKPQQWRKNEAAVRNNANVCQWIGKPPKEKAVIGNLCDNSKQRKPERLPSSTPRKQLYWNICEEGEDGGGRRKGQWKKSHYCLWGGRDLLPRRQRRHGEKAASLYAWRK